MNQLPVLYPSGEQLRLAVRGAATYALSWFQHGQVIGQVIGQVRIDNPFR